MRLQCLRVPSLALPSPPHPSPLTPSLPLSLPPLLQFAQWLLGQKLAMATAAVSGYSSAAVAATGMLPPGYMQQQVAGTTYFQPVMPGHPPFSPQGMPQGMPPYPMPPQMGPPSHVRMVALGLPQPLPLRGRAPA